MTDDALPRFHRFAPNVVGFSGFQKIRECYPRLPIAIVSSEEDKHTIREALTIGAVGYLPKSTSKSELAKSIERVLSGSISIPGSFVIQNAQGNTGATEAMRARLAELTPQQLRVLDLIRRGLIPARWLDGRKARVALAILLSNRASRADIAGFFASP